MHSTHYNHSGIYCLSKAAIHSMTDTLRMELKPFGVHVMVVAPGKLILIVELTNDFTEFLSVY